MTKQNILRWGLTGSTATIALVGALAPAQAYETKMTFSEVSIVFDTTVSMGGSILTSDRETAFLPEGNGGPVDPRTSGVVVIPGAPVVTFSGDAATATYTSNPDNFDGGANTDDGRLNFGSGDFIGGNVKANHDLQITWQNYKIFARAVGFYDVIMNDRQAGNRSELTPDALGDVGRNYELLDAFISADYTIDDMPVNLRLGKQVINWGESTFILGGNNVFNPIDVGAFRRPGSEIKEALVPVAAISGSISLPFDVSLSGYYALDFEPFELDPSGTPFSNADVIASGSGPGGNQDRVSFLASSPFTGMRRNCAAAGGTLAVQTNGLLNDPLSAQAGKIDCLDDDAFTGIYANTISHTASYTIGQAERTRFGLATLLATQGASRETFGIIDNAGEGEPHVRDDGQFGISARYFAEELGGTEFAAYYQNYHSRLPFISERVGGPGTISIGVNAASAQATAGGIGGRQILPAGCGFSGAIAAGVAGLTAEGAARGTNAAFGDAGAANADGIGLDDTLVEDPQDLINAALSTTINTNYGISLVQSATGSYDNVYNVMVVNCLLAYHQSGNVNFGAGNVAQLLDGAETISLNSDIDLLIEYPEDISVFGLSFNTTLFGWGVQGDFTFRPEAPFQIDTDSLTIAAAWKSCAFQAAAVGASAAGGVPAGRTPDGSGVLPDCIAAGGAVFAAGQDPYVKGWRNNEMFTGQIGSTATFTGSDWWVDAIGADLGILVTEVGAVYVPNVEDTNLVTDNDASTTTAAELASRARPVYASTGCQGSELPLGGLLGLDGKTAKQCRPKDFSAGLVMLLRTEYNNAFDTGFVIAPQIVYAYDFEGTTPAPYGNYLEDRQSVGLSVTGTLNNNFRVGVNYSNFFGGHISNKAKDQDFASLTASYSF